MIIKAGTYQFKDTLVVADNIATEIELSMVAPGETVTREYFYLAIENYGEEGYYLCLHWFDTDQGLENEDTFYSFSSNAWFTFDEKAPTVTVLNDSEVSPEFYAWFTANAVSIGSQGSTVTITYNGVETTIEAGKTATLACGGKKMKTDVVITTPEAEDNALPIEIATEAEMTALLESGEVGGVYKYTGTTGTYENGALYVLEEEAVTNNGSHILNASNNEKIDITQYIDQEWRQLNGVSLAGDLGTTYTISSTSSSGKVIISIGGSYTSYIGNPSGSDCVGMETIVQGEYHCLVDMFGPA